MTGPRWIKQWINNLAALNDLFRDDDGKVDFEALGREEYQFRQALVTHKFAKSERAKEAYQQAMTAYSANVANGKKGGRPKKSPQDAPNGNAGVDMTDAGNGAASKSPTSCDTLTADGDTREDSQDCKSVTSANIYGDAATREGADVSTTVSRNMRRVPQNEAPAHGFSGGRTAQGTMSRSPEAAAQSGKDYDQETAKTRDTREDSRGRYAPPSCSPEDGNPAETAPSHGGSVASLEARQGQARESQRRAGADSVRGTPLHRAPARQQAKNSRCPNSREDFHAFVADNNLHEGLAEEWYAMHEAREWVDRDGKPIKDWRGALYNYCTKTEQKRRTA